MIRLRIENPVVRLAVFAVLLLAVFAASVGVGRAVGPLDDAPSEPTPMHSGPGHS